MAKPSMILFNAQHQVAPQKKLPTGMHCATSNEMLKNQLFGQLPHILGLDKAVALDVGTQRRLS